MSDQQHTPPPFALKLIRLMCREELVEEIEGNLLEYHWIHSSSKKVNALKFWWQVLTYLRPSTLKMLKLKNSGPMFMFNPKIAVRNLMKHRVSTSISLLGFIIGLLSTVFIYFYIRTETSYDNFHTDADQIYRMLRKSSIDGSPYNIGVTSGPFAAALLNDYPATIRSATRVYPQEGLIGVDDKKFFEDKLIFADKNFFQFFSFPLLEGDYKTVLQHPNSVVISSEIARKYFGYQDPIGQTLTMDNEYQFVVTGILDEFPAKSHLDFNMVFAMDLLEKFEWFDNWWSNGLMTYVNIATPQEATQLDSQLQDFMNKYFADDFDMTNNRIGLHTEPLRDIYFNHDTRFDRVQHCNFNNVLIVGVIGIIILFIASFNYINLSIAMAFKRAKEIGIRKVLGVEKARLVMQFLGESTVILIFSFIVAISLAIMLRPGFNALFDLDIIFNWSSPEVYMFGLGLMLIILITSGLYPALLMSGFHPLNILKSGKLPLGKNILVRKGLVVTQFALSIFMIIATIMIALQLDYLRSKPLGYDKESLIIVHLNNQEIRSSSKLFKQDLLKHPNIESVTGASGEPGGFHDGTVLRISESNADPKVRTVFSDADYLNTLNIQIAHGRSFDKKYANEDSMAMVINEKAMHELGMTPEELIGRDVEIPMFGVKRKIVGIIKNYHFTALNNNIEPQAILAGFDYNRRFIIRVKSQHISETIDYLQTTFARYSPEYPITYQFHEEGLERLYKDEQNQARLFSLFSGISILLACMGIFGLAAYSAEQRQKELGIRKILGASVKQVIFIISREFIFLVGFASLVAIPMSYIFMEGWLGDFAYRISLWSNWTVFVAGSLLAGIIAFLTIAIKTYNTAASNPTNCIRYE